MRLTRWRPCMTPAAAPAICPSGRRRENLSSASDKNNPLACFRKSEVECSRSDPDRGAYASSRTLDRNAMGATGGLDEPASRARQRRVVLVPRRWHQVAWLRAARRPGQSSPVPGPVPGESTKDTVKTIAQGRPDVQAKPVVTAASFFYCWRAMGAVGTRPSLRPLSIRRARE